MVMVTVEVVWMIVVMTGQFCVCNMERLNLFIGNCNDNIKDNNYDTNHIKQDTENF